MNRRIFQLSLLRAFAALSIVAIHVTSGQTTIDAFAFTWNQLARYASPMFIIISGFLLFIIEKRKTSPSYRYFFKHRFTKVAIPYVSWTIIYSLFTYRHTWMYEFSAHSSYAIMKKTVYHLFTGTGYSHLYFILIMIQLYALFPFFYKWIIHYPLRLLLSTFFISMIGLCAIYLHQLYYITLPPIGITYTTLATNWFFYFALGLYVAKNYETIVQYMRSKKYTIGLLCALLWGGSFFLLYIDGQLTNTFDNSVKPTTFLYAVATFVVLFFLTHTIHLPKRVPGKKKAMQAIEWLASNSFLLYLIHPLYLTILVLISEKAGNPSFWIGTDKVIYLYIVTVFLSYGSIAIINRLPFTTILGGRKTT